MCDLRREFSKSIVMKVVNKCTMTGLSVIWTFIASKLGLSYIDRTVWYH